MEFGAESLLPPVVAIACAIATRRVVLPLAAGVLVGAALLVEPLIDTGGVANALPGSGSPALFWTIPSAMK